MGHVLTWAVAALALLPAALLAAGPDGDAADVRPAVPAWEVPAAAGATGFATAALLSAQAPEAALLHASLLNTRLHGNFGEALVAAELHRSGGWVSLSPRSAPQGLDHVWIKFDERGVPRDMIVGETKYGTSRLGMTRDGRQMGAGWISKRLAERADWYAQEAEAAKTDGARLHFRSTSQYLRAAAEGRIRYRSELFRVDVKGNEAHVKITSLDADGQPTGTTVKLKPIPMEGTKANLAKAQIMREAERRFPVLSAAERRAWAEELYARAENAQAALSAKAPAARLALVSARTLGAAAALAGGIDAAAQLLAGRSVDWKQTGSMAGLGAASAGAAEAVQLSLSWSFARSAWARGQAVALGRSLGLSPLRSVSLLPKLAGGAVGAVVFSYGGYALGLYGAKDAHRSAIAGVGGVAAGAATHAGMMAAAAAWGTASTGTAISSLSGAAATNASLALYGGGSVAAGGGGMAAGAVVVGGAVAVAAIAVTAAVMYGFHLHDAAQEWKRIGYSIDAVRDFDGDFPGNPWAPRPATAF